MTMSRPSKGNTSSKSKKKSSKIVKLVSKAPAREKPRGAPSSKNKELQ